MDALSHARENNANYSAAHLLSEARYNEGDKQASNTGKRSLIKPCSAEVKIFTGRIYAYRANKVLIIPGLNCPAGGYGVDIFFSNISTIVSNTQKS